MTERLKTLRSLQWDRVHHAARIALDPDMPLPYRNPALSDVTRTSLRTQLALSMETPYLFPGELIAFTRTVPNLPFLFSEEEWAAISAAHYIHEMGNVSNLSPDYGKVIASGLIALRESLGDTDLHAAMRRSIDALLDLTKRYEQAAREAGNDELADTLARVPAYGARTFREALQSLRILHFAMWCEGDYHNTLGRFDQYMYPYLKADLAADRLTQVDAFELLCAFFLACNRDSDLYPGMQQGDNGQSMMLGGCKEDGSCAVNELTYICLKASLHNRRIDPKSICASTRIPPLNSTSFARS